MKKARKRLTYANVMSSLAVFLVLGGASAVAANQLGKNTVGSKQLKPGAVTAPKLKKDAVAGAKIKAGAITEAKLADGAVTGAKVKDGSLTGAKISLSTLGTVPSANTANSANSASTASNLAGYSRKGQTRVVATPGASEEAARLAAPEVTLLSSGPLTVYAKCFTDTSSPRTYAVIYLKTSLGGVLLDSDDDQFEGDPFLEPNTDEEDRELLYDNVSADEADVYGNHSPEFSAMAPDGTTVRGELQLALKNGNLPEGNGIYGAGDACLFAGDLTTLNG